MSDDIGNIRSTILAWLLACCAGLVATVALVVIGGYSVTPAAFLGIVLVALVGGLLTWTMRPLPRFGDSEGLMGGWALANPRKPGAVRTAPAARAAVPAAVAAPVAPTPAAETAVAPSTDAPPAEDHAPKTSGTEADGRQPQALTAPRGGKADDLKEIEGIGPALEKLCNEMGIFHWDQIASWGAAEVAWMDSNLKGFKGRVTRDKWVRQAQLIVAEGVEAFRVRAQSNDY